MKIKVDLPHIFVEKGGMHCIVKGLSIPISSLEFEGGEYFIRPTGILEDILGVWWCYKCQNWNSRFDSACIYCGQPR